MAGDGETHAWHDGHEANPNQIVTVSERRSQGLIHRHNTLDEFPKVFGIWRDKGEAVTRIVIYPRAAEAA
jgi:hypothetical protein